MKAGRNKIVKIVTVVIAALVLSSNTFAMNLKTDKTEIPEKMVQNLAVGIASENLGLKTSCIYFAGCYEIKGLVKPLVEQLSKESNPNTKVLIALTLYRIDTPEGIKAIEKLAKNDADPLVKKMGNAILAGFKNVQSYSSNFNVSNK